MAPGDELIDLIDEHGRTVRTVTRREMRGKRLPHRCVYVLIFNRAGEILIHKRTSTKDVYPSYWDVTVGGVLAAGESFGEGAEREVREELGVAVQPELLFPFRYADTATIVQAMVFRVTHDAPFQFQVEEIVEGSFVPIDRLEVLVNRERFCPDGLAVWEEFKRRRGIA